VRENLPSQGVDAVLVESDEVAALRGALELGQLRLHYQPKVDCGSGRLAGLEALVRWEHPIRGMVPPGEFIALAEASGLIGPLGEWVLVEACRQQAAWIEELGGDAPPMVCVNVSGRQFGPGFVELVRETIATTGALPEMLCVEVTESVMMGDVDGAVGIMHELKALGLAVSIDDFGTGYSSLAHLKRFPVDELKIDKSFIDGLGTDPDDTAIVAAIVAMGHALGLLVIAEGVETIDQLERLRGLGCDLAQGYLFSRPLPPDDVVALGSVLQPALGGDASPAPARAPDVVLVVDDTADIRQLAKVSLATSGFDVIEAASGEEALSEARRARPACIVLDVSMPGMNGFEVCHALRADAVTASAAIVMLTSRADAGDKVKAFSAGADDYMVKPFAPRDLVSRVRQALARRVPAP
jgi:EAL domain-containing protein (putative c-di-GMP-specific phosphodiesterase class I)/CheY-like chemotaxis protein